MPTSDAISPSALSGESRALFDSIPGFLALLEGPEDVIAYANAAWRALAGDRALIGRPFRDAFPELEGRGVFDALETVRRTGTGLSRAALPVLPEGSESQRYVDFVFQPVAGAAGAPRTVCVTGHEVTAHLEALQMARRSEQELQTLADALPVLISYMDADQRYRFNNKLYEAWFPRKREDIQGQTIESVIGEKAYAAVRDKIARVLSGERFQFEQMMPYSTTAHRHIQVEYVPRFAETGTVEGWYALVQDVTRTKQLERQKDELTRELAHRLKNQLAVVQAIVSQSLRHATSPNDSRHAIAARIEALGRAQNTLMGDDWTRADIGATVRDALEPYEDGRGKFTLDGPAWPLEPQQGLSLSLAIHELATNAIKYGALSTETGRVAIAWTIDEVGALTFTWTETGGPTVTAPEKTGFGTRLIDRMVAPAFAGQARIAYAATGVQFTLEGRLGVGSKGEA